ncbi:MAG: MobF family relaxase [Acidimicrobiales bacterium]
MLVLSAISASSVPYWSRTAAHSTWLGEGAHALGLTGEVGCDDLRQVLLGRSPGGGPLVPRPSSRRRHGWDMVLAAPKSVSLLAATLSPAPAQEVREAFRQAVTDTVALAQQRAVKLRRAGRQVPGQAVVAAFEHLESNAGDPHLHCHAVLANLGFCPEIGWGCLVQGPLWLWREALGAGFQLALRERLRETGLGFSWRLSPGGLGELTSVPEEAIRASSSRSLAVLAESRSFGAASSASSRVAQGATRPSASQRSHQGRLSGTPQASSLSEKIVRAARDQPAQPSPPPSDQLVTKALAARASNFKEPDVLVALAETSTCLNLPEAAAWSSQWCAAQRLATSSQQGKGLRTSAFADALDRHVFDAAFEARLAHMAQVDRHLAGQQLESLGAHGPIAVAAAQLACGGEGVAVVPRAPWLAQAACIDAARSTWQAAGFAVEVMVPTDIAALRWRPLTSLRPTDTVGGWDRGRTRQRVLVVDAADHLSPLALAKLVDEAGASTTKLVLVVGGTQPGRGPCLSSSLDRLQDELAQGALHELPEPGQLLAAGPTGGFSLATGQLPANPGISVPGIGVSGAFTGMDAIAHLTAAWRSQGGRAVMVAYGPPEAEALNVLARSALLATGALGNGTVLARQAPHGYQPDALKASLPTGRPPVVRLGSREYALGEKVMALRRFGTVRAATWGSVVALGRASVTVEWSSVRGPARSEVGPEQAASLGYGYATTVPYLKAWAGRGTAPSLKASQEQGRQAKLLVLGDPLGLGSVHRHVAAAWVAVASPTALALCRPGARQRAGAGELAVSWPDEEMLQRAGPRPLSRASRQHWEREVAHYAHQRVNGLVLGRPLSPGLSRSPSSGLGNQLSPLARRAGPPRALSLR